MSDPVLRRRPPRRAAPPVLDAAQQRVVAHPGGPLLVLAGPGTGKTTTLVEAVVDRIERRGLAPEQVLVLTFSRKAAHELRERVTARLGRTTRGALAMTFHSYAYALLRRELAAAGGPPLRLLSGPEQDLEVARLLAGELADGAVSGSSRWPERAAPGAAPARVPARAARPAPARPGARCRRDGPRGARRVGGAARVDGRRRLPRRLRGALRARPVRRGARPQRPWSGRPPPCSSTTTSCGRASGRPGLSSSSTSTRTPTPPRCGCCRRSPATGATWWPWATPTRASTRSAAPTCAASSTCPTSSGRSPASALRWSSCARGGAPDRPCSRRPAPSRDGCPRAASRRRSATCSPTRPSYDARVASRCCSRRRRPARRPSSPTSCAAPTCTTASRGPTWRCCCGRPRVRSRCCAAACTRRGRPGRRSRPTRCRWPRSPWCARCSTCSSRRCAPTRSAARTCCRCWAVRWCAPTPWPSAGCGGRCARPTSPRAAASRPTSCWSRRCVTRGCCCPSTVRPARRSTGCTRWSARSGRRPGPARPRTCCGRRGRPAAWPAGSRPRACPAAAAVRWPTGRSTRCSRCSTRRPATSTGCRTPPCWASSTTSTPRRSPVTRSPSGRPRATPSGS